MVACWLHGTKNKRLVTSTQPAPTHTQNFTVLSLAVSENYKGFVYASVLYNTTPIGMEMLWNKSTGLLNQELEFQFSHQYNFSQERVLLFSGARVPGFSLGQ